MFEGAELEGQDMLQTDMGPLCQSRNESFAMSKEF